MTDAKGNTAVPKAEHGDHDRVAMLSLRADGTPDQTAPEIIGDPEFARAATREQFTQQAVSAVDQAERPALGLGGGADVEHLEQDPAIAELQVKHDAAAGAAERAADATVDELFTRDQPATSAPTGGRASTSKPASAGK